MDLIVIAVVLLLITVAVVAGLLTIVSRAVNNVFNWIIYTFGNEPARREAEERMRTPTPREPRGCSGATLGLLAFILLAVATGWFLGLFLTSP